MENINLLDKVYLPQIEKEGFRNSKAFKLLDDKGLDTSQLEGYEEKSSTPVTFDAYIESGGSKEDWIAKHVTEENKNMFFGAIGDFVTDLGKDGLRSIAVGATNGVDFAVNLAPVLTKLYDLSPIGMPPGTLEASGVQEDIVAKANAASEKLGEAREFLKNYKDDGNVVSKIVQVMGQDLMYSIPIYNKLKSVGVPTIPSLVISGGVGGAIGIEKKLKFTGNDQEQYNSTFTQDFFGKDIAEIKRIVGILPNTPYDEIADEVTQALEYGAFSYAIPKLIQGFQFMKKNIPYFAGGAAAVTMTGDDAEASPIKAITNAIFKSTVKETVEKKITSGSGQQILNTIQNTPGVKSSEIKWIGLDTFLKDRKKVSQKEILDFIQANRIDVNEIKFGKPSKAQMDRVDEFDSNLNDFEIRYEGDTGTAVNYDVYNVAFSKELSKELGVNDKGTMDFSTLQKVLGDAPSPNKMKLLENGNLTTKEDPSELSGVSMTDKDKARFNTFQITPLEFEKYTYENTRRKILKEGPPAAKFEQYTEPGGEDYKELVFTIKKGGMDIGIPVEFQQAINIEGRPGPPIMTKQQGTAPFKNPSHMDVKSEIAHVRFKTRYGEGLDDNLKILSVEEMQSDFATAVRKQEMDYPAFDKDTPASKVTDFPFKNNWYELTLKRLIRYAADNGFDAISIPRASTIQDRYQLTTRIDDFHIGSFDAARKEVGLEAYDQDGVLQISDLYSFDRVEREYGKEVLDRIIKKGKTLTQQDYDDVNTIVELPKTIETGGEGKIDLYNVAIPKFMKKYGKKWNAEVTTIELQIMNAPGPLPVTLMKITPEMKKSVQETPQSLFSYFGGFALGAEAVSETIQNNIISEQTN